MMNYFFQIFISAVSYFFFNMEFFKVSQSIMQEKKLGAREFLWTTILNYTVFVLCTNLELHLIFNWLIFLMLLGFELYIIFHQQLLVCFLFSLLGTQLCLAINIFSRSLLAVTMDVSLFAFDNQTSLPGNLKLYPVLIGFFLTAFLLWITHRYKTLKELILVINDDHNLKFLTGLLVGMYLYLCMNLIVYYNGENILIVKLWSMKSSIFVMVGEMLSVILAIRLAQLNAYRKESQRTKQIMQEEKMREEELRMIAIRDPLTGCENRLQLEKRLQEAKKQAQRMYIAFLDLNGLKHVNDTYGHEMGDVYLLELTGAIQKTYGYPHTMYRYGGDEFILLFEHMSKEKAMECLDKMQEALENSRIQNAYDFSMSFSYGVVAIEEEDTIEALIHKADERMYDMKKQMQKKKCSGRSE